MNGRKIPQPFRQGDLDALCGPYCLLNVVRYLRPPFSTARGIHLHRKLLRHLERHRGLIRRVTYGTGFNELSRALVEVVCPLHGIERSRPFKRRREVTLEQFLDTMDTFLRDHGGIVLISLSGVYDHWTLVRKVTARSLLLYDSHDLQRLGRTHCALKPSGETLKRHLLHPTRTTFLWVD